MNDPFSNSGRGTCLQRGRTRLRGFVRGGSVWWVLPLLLGICLLRALPSYHRGTYATEGGAWLSQMWQIGFWEAILTIRPDYSVLGNLCVIKAADLITVWSTGSPLGATGPFWQHTMAALYVALNFLLVFTVLRRHHGWKRALLVTVVMLLAPDLDNENRVFGEANNVGFFSVLAVVFIYYDFWLTPAPGWKRVLGWLAVIVFHLLTSPLAGVVAAGFSSLLLVRLAWQAWRGDVVCRQWRALATAFALPILLAGLTIWRARNHGPSATMAAESAAGGLAALQPFLIEYVFCRQWLYPITLNFYLSANDAITLAVLAAVLTGIGVWLWAEKQRSPLPADWGRISGLLLISVVSLAVAFLTLYLRRWLTGKGLHYETLWPARYYLVQTMLMAGFLCLVLLRCGDLWPRFRRGAWGLSLLMGLNFAVLQYPHTKAVLTNPDPAVTARRWSAQLGRVRDLHTLTGDLPASLEQKIPALLDVPMYIEGHAVPVPAGLMMEAAKTETESRPDICPIMSADASVLTKAAPAAGRRLEVRNMRLIPRAQGVLLTVDLHLTGFNFIARRRQLRLGELPGQPVIKSWWYAADQPPALTKSGKSRRELKNWLFRIAVWWDHPIPLEQIRSALTNLPVALGDTPESPLATGVLLESHGPLPFSALRDDATAALRVFRQVPALDWHWGDSLLQASHLTVTPQAITAPHLKEQDFSESAYLQLNPDVHRALDMGAITSGSGHYRAFGKEEGRNFAIRSLRWDLTGAGLTSDQLSGLVLETDRVRREAPTRFRVVLQGPDGKQFSFDLLPPEGRRDFSVNFLPAAWLGEPFRLQNLELQFDFIDPDSAFRPSRLILTKKP